MATLASMAQYTMDLYYQEFKSNEDFFRLIHFKYLNSICYAAMLQEEYELSYRQNLQVNGFPEGTLNSDWFIQEGVKVKRANSAFASFETSLKYKPFAFRYDKSNSGIRDVVGLNSSCSNFVRMSAEEKWKMHHLPVSSVVFWFPVKDKLYFSNVSCGLSDALVMYIPAIDDLEDDDMALPDVVQEGVVQRTLQLMFQAKQQGIPIDMSQDGNPNKVMQTEINNHLTKAKAVG